MPVYVVGGFVRDLLLAIENLDIDIVVEGDGLRFARELAQELKAEVTPHSKFGTSVLHFKDGTHLDVATARREFYEEPSALPTVQPGTIREDMDRRDFTINSLAIKLEPDGNRPLLDFNQGQPDLADKIIRVLHENSFVDDPTRIFRAIRFEQRLGFHLSRETEAELVKALPIISKLSGHRLTNELVAILKEKQFTPYLRRMQELGVLVMVQSELSCNEKDFAVLERLEHQLRQPENQLSIGEADPVSVRLLATLWSLDSDAFESTLHRLDLKGQTGDKLRRDRSQCQAVLKQFGSADTLSALQIYDALSPGSVESVYWLLAITENESNESVQLAVERFYSSLRQAGELSLTGDDFIRMGLKPGPLFQRVFRELRRARLEGEISSREEEEKLVREKFHPDG